MYHDSHWDDITTIKDISSMTYYKYQNKNYYFFGEKIGQTLCQKQCDTETTIYGKDCVTFETMLYQWLIYNNNFGVKTIVQLDVKQPLIQTINPNVLVYNKNDTSVFNLMDIQDFLQTNHLYLMDDIDNVVQFIVQHIKNIFHGDVKQLPLKNYVVYKLFKNKVFMTWLPMDPMINKLLHQYIDDMLQNDQINVMFDLLQLSLDSNFNTNIIYYYNYYIQIVNEQLMPFRLFFNAIQGLIHLFSAESETTLISYTTPLTIKYYNLFFNKYLHINNILYTYSEDNCVTNPLLPLYLKMNAFRKLTYEIKSNKKTPFSFHATQHVITKSFVRDLNLKMVKPQRAGVILYTLTHFGFGIDSTYHEYTDFGGGIRYKTDKDVIQGALREFREETLNSIKIQYGQDNLVLYDNKMLILFIKVNDMDEITNQFNNAYKKAKKSEMSGIKWLTYDELKMMINNYHSPIYSRVKHFLKNAGDFYNDL